MPGARQMPPEPSDLDALYADAVGQHRSGRLVEAAAAYRKILALQPNIAEVQNNLGIALCQLGQFDEAMPRFERAIALNPRLADAYNNLGNVLRQQGKLDEATTRYRKAVAIKPDFAEAHNNLGNILQQQGKLDEARSRFERAIALNPGYAEAYFNLGETLWHLGKPDEAKPRFEQALALRPAYPEAHNSLGNILWQQGRAAPAAAHFERAVALAPNDADAHGNLGISLWQQGRLEESAARLQHAISLRPCHPETHYNLGITRWHQGRVEEAQAEYNQALALRPDYAEAERGLASCYLVQGDYARGWPAYEARLRTAGYVDPPKLPRWTGQPLSGRRLLLCGEQGLGDTIHFLRYARMLKAAGAHVALAVARPLGRLLSDHPDIDELLLPGKTVELSHYDFYLPVMSAAGVFHTELATIPREIPYLWADPELVESWRAELSRIDGLKIGIAWQGSPDYVFDRWRSFPLAALAPLARLPGVRLVSLQKGFGSEQIAAVDFPVIDFGNRVDEAAGPLMDTAAMIANLDLVITADTAIAHLAGALGAPTFLALESAADWRWLRARDDSPWYPTLRLFRQRQFGQWPEVFQRMAEAAAARLDPGQSESEARTLDLRPSLSETYFRSGKSVWQKGRLEEALARYTKGLALDPQHSAAHNDLALILAHQGWLEPAVAHFEQAIAARPDFAEAYNNLGTVLWQQGKLDEAAQRMRQAVTLRPDFSEAHNNLGSALAQQNQPGEAAAHFQRAIELTADNAQPYYNLGKLLLNQDRLQEAFAQFQKAVALRPDIAEMQYALATCYLLAEDYERGWPQFEWRLRLPGGGVEPNLPRWRGEPLAGRRLLLMAESGLGDTIQFIRFVRQFKERGAHVMLAVQAALGPLLQSFPGVDEIFLYGSNVELPRCDYYLRLLSSPGMLGTTAATIPRETAYLRADERLTDLWRQELAGIEGFKIGIVWQGSRDYLSDRFRSVPLAQFAPLARVPGVRLVSLQKGFGSEQISEVDFPVINLASRLDEGTGPFMDTAAVIRNLDLVVTPDTAIGHLAGALGAPVWLALAFAADWRWQRGREDTPWYPATRLFRQRASGQWPEVFERMAEVLKNR